jgi:hypothetical protein
MAHSRTPRAWIRRERNERARHEFRRMVRCEHMVQSSSHARQISRTGEVSGYLTAFAIYLVRLEGLLSE